MKTWYNSSLPFSCPVPGHLLNGRGTSWFTTPFSCLSQAGKRHELHGRGYGSVNAVSPLPDNIERFDCNISISWDFTFEHVLHFYNFNHLMFFCICLWLAFIFPGQSVSLSCRQSLRPGNCIAARCWWWWGAWGWDIERRNGQCVSELERLNSIEIPRKSNPWQRLNSKEQSVACEKADKALPFLRARSLPNTLKWHCRSMSFLRFLYISVVLGIA